ncbi:hypothetical protein M408DRAFT_328297, partial [Serendipita vermifera MAFF 305830]
VASRPDHHSGSQSKLVYGLLSASTCRVEGHWRRGSVGIDEGFPWYVQRRNAQWMDSSYR